MKSRNTTSGFAARTRKNLELSESEFRSGSDFHVVTQLVNSLLGIVVVPLGVHRRGHKAFSSRLEVLYDQGWPAWDIQLDDPQPKKRKTETLGDLVWHLRNAASHGRFHFLGGADSRYLREVELQVEDAPGEEADVNWRAQIPAEGLYEFCRRLSRHIDEHFG